MNVLVIDGQGGNVGRQLIRQIAERLPGCALRIVGTNSIATASMLKSANVPAATGENAVIVGCRWADAIVGPIGIVIADALLGEVTPTMAIAVGQSAAVRILIPLNRCDTLISGVGAVSTADLIEDAVCKLEALMKR